MISDIISGAEKLGALSATAVWAFFNILMIVYIVWDLRAKKQSSQMAWEARIKDAETDGMMAKAVERLAEQIRELRIRIKCVRREDD